VTGDGGSLDTPLRREREGEFSPTGGSSADTHTANAPGRQRAVIVKEVARLVHFRRAF
jgi:hypothetical protein